ncbi:MAG: thioredoxin domain-containing protein [Roseibacillus sp.]
MKLPRSTTLGTTVLALAAGLSLGCSPDADTVKADQDAKPKHTNRLANEKSPYLLQHAHNPVDWFPWGAEAFEEAKKEDKPIFLSIGYSTCHWCHVMERETFEDEATAEYLNEHFVCIKIDREERPDVDKIYMSAVQALSEGRGGWPLSAFLTPELKPFFGGTYFPNPTFNALIRNVVKAWVGDRANIDKTAERLTKFLKDREADNNAVAGGAAKFNDDVLRNALAKMKAGFDPVEGGWGAAPKFPSPSQPRLMLRLAARLGDQEAIDQVLLTCDKMAAGGIYDHLGGGFARYSTDAKWLVPHFEKMLYDNAQLVQLYLDAYLVSGEKRHAEVVRDVFRYILRDMTHPEGGFYSAEDADSEGKEGKFYCFTTVELKKLLSKEEFAAVEKYYGVTDGGNFVDHSDPDHLKDQNVFFRTGAKLEKAEMSALAAAEKKIFAYRGKRVRPGLDDKILASWNGLMLGAIARAGRVLDEPSYLAAAQKNFEFIRAKFWDQKERRLYHRWRDGERDSAQLLDTHTFLLEGVLDLYEVTLDPAPLEFAVKIADRLIEAFYDKEKGGFYQATASADLIMRVKDYYDGAEPSGNSTAISALLRLAKITDNKKYREPAMASLAQFSSKITQFPRAVPYMVGAVDFSANEPKRVVLVGDVKSEPVQNMLKIIHGNYQPNKVVLGTEGPVEEFSRTTLKKQAKKGEVVVFLCQGKFCELPTGDPKKVIEGLGRSELKPKEE